MLLGAPTRNTSKKLETWQSLNKIPVCFTESKALMLLLYMQGYKISFLKELYRKKSEAILNLAQISPILQAAELTLFAERKTLQPSVCSSPGHTPQ